MFVFSNAFAESKWYKVYNGIVTVLFQLDMGSNYRTKCNLL